MLCSKVRNTQMGLVPLGDDGRSLWCMFLEDGELHFVCVQLEHTRNAWRGMSLLIWWSVSLKAFRLISHCTTCLIRNCYMIIKQEMKKQMRKAACACGKHPGWRHSGASSQKRGLQGENAAQPDKPHSAESLKMCPAGRCNVFFFIPPSPGSLNGTQTGTRGISCQGKTGPEVGKRKKKGKTAGGKNNNERKSEDRLHQRNGSQFVWAGITSTATRNQTAGSLRTWLSGFLQ